MKVVDSIFILCYIVNVWCCNGESVGFVFIMGNLYDGYFKFVKKVKVYNDNVVVSIFVNLMQFGVNEDLDVYFCIIEEDKVKFILVGVDVVFLLSVVEMYFVGFDV